MEPKKKRYSALRDKSRQPLIDLRATVTIIDILDFLQGRILPTHYIKAWFGRPYYIKTLLGRMAQAHLIAIPEEGKMHRDVLQRPRAWQVAPLGYKMLLEHGRLRATENLGSSSFHHDYIASVVQFSFDIAPREIFNLKKRTLADIMAHPDCPDPNATSAIPALHVRPDAPLFGYEYTRLDGRKRYLYLHGHEDDRSTENLRGYARQSLERKLDNYATYLTKGLYHKHYGISNCSTAWTFISPGRAEGFLAMVAQKTPHLADRILVKVLPDFTHFDKFPPPTGWALTEDWRTCNGALNILTILKGETVDRRSQAQQVA